MSLFLIVLFYLCLQCGLHEFSFLHYSRGSRCNRSRVSFVVFFLEALSFGTNRLNRNFHTQDFKRRSYYVQENWRLQRNNYSIWANLRGMLRVKLISPYIVTSIAPSQLSMRNGDEISTLWRFTLVLVGLVAYNLSLQIGNFPYAWTQMGKWNLPEFNIVVSLCTR